MSVDLAAEMRTARAALTAEDRAELIGAGIAPELLNQYALIGTAAMRIKGGLWELAPDGSPAYVTPILVGDSASPETPDPLVYARGLGDLVDLVAWHPKHPAHWALRRHVDRLHRAAISRPRSGCDPALAVGLAAGWLRRPGDPERRPGRRLPLAVRMLRDHGRKPSARG